MMLREATAQREQALKDAQAMIEHARAEAAQVAEAAARRRRRGGHAARADGDGPHQRRREGGRDRRAPGRRRHRRPRGRAGDRARVRRDADAALVDRAIQGLPAALCGPPRRVTR